MPWNSPATFLTGRTVTASDWNTYVTDNISYLNARPGDEYLTNEGSDYTTTSTSFVAVDSTNLSISLTSNGGDVLIGFSGSVSNTTGGQSVYMDVFVDVDGGGYNSLTGDDGLVMATSTNAGHMNNVSFIFKHTGLSSGSVYTYRLYWQVTANTGTMYAGAGTSTLDLHPQFWIKEV